MPPIKNRVKNEFWYTLNPDSSAALFWGEHKLGLIYVPYAPYIDHTVDFLRAIGTAYHNHLKTLLEK